MQTPTLYGEKYFMAFTNEMSGRVSGTLLTCKDGALDAFQTYWAQAEKRCGKEIKSLRTDRGGQYLGKRFQQYLREARIQHIVTPLYSLAQNGLAERMNHTLMENARCILLDAQLSTKFWGYAVLTAAHIHNHLPAHTRNNLSPIANWTAKEPGIGYLRVFGSTAWVHIPKENRSKLDPKSTKWNLIGYVENAGTKVNWLYDPARIQVIRSHDVIIDESPLRDTDYGAKRRKAKIGLEPEAAIK